MISTEFAFTSLLLINEVLLISEENEHTLIFDEAPIQNLQAKQVE